MARPVKYNISRITNFNRIALLCFLGLLSEAEAAKILDFNKVTFANKMTEWINAEGILSEDPDLNLGNLRKLGALLNK